MKKIILITILLLSLVLSGCFPIPQFYNEDNNIDYYEDNEPSEMTISDYLQRHSSERMLFFRITGDITKNSKCKLFILEDGEFSVSQSEVLELGEIARMSDDEIIDAYDAESSYREYDDYNLKIYTDDHGEQTEKETIELGNDGDSLYFGESYNTSIYNTNFSGFKYYLDALIWDFDVYSLIKTDTALILDQPYSPTFNGIVDDEEEYNEDEDDEDDDDYEDYDDDDDEYEDYEEDDDEINEEDLND